MTLAHKKYSTEFGPFIAELTTSGPDGAILLMSVKGFSKDVVLGNVTFFDDLINALSFSDTFLKVLDNDLGEWVLFQKRDGLGYYATSNGYAGPLKLDEIKEVSECIRDIFIKELM